ncbi:hypothetical protein PPSIR1_13365 [Plesiocystis pacifica SIR-1]|uniref:STAS domain-containing protein n=2 Tax=Plesiocystis pacifica TaxID=191768 RepID=A6GEQ3_9BACT|nr:hypothetical protein PPSIR1_13365 [Plesiocystis pacifica SIR-1]
MELVAKLPSEGLEPGLRDELVATLRGLAVEADMAELTLEAREEELAAARELLARRSYPLIQVQIDVLCLPIVGPVDASIMEQIIEEVMGTVVARRARWLIVDLTGALLGDVIAADALRRLFRMLRLIGVRSALSGVSPTLAQTLVQMSTPLDIPVHRSLAAALDAAKRGAKR